MTAENPENLPFPTVKRSGQRLSLAEVDAQQDEILRQLDDLNSDILKLLEDFRVTLGKEVA